MKQSYLLTLFFPLISFAQISASPVECDSTTNCTFWVPAHSINFPVKITNLAKGFDYQCYMLGALEDIYIDEGKASRKGITDIGIEERGSSRTIYFNTRMLKRQQDDLSLSLYTGVFNEEESIDCTAM